ncbi:translesion error-prone DNA polymerase V autoproteolytic subunit [Pseudomonas sp. RIT-PI-AD]|uniref:LexA family protein n=1 Tax=Pseudomonas sp. RIT-PI-AD TaxID=3035294 RepID=UPI0021D8DD88|nr:translesion error-prone DNA polymerase V autoproteolytic subunit [Pseudomonas sp. RIT-PI-AD]
MSCTILGPLAEGGPLLSLFEFRVPAGFPSPAQDHLEQPISLDELLAVRAPHTYLAYVEGDSMQGAGIFDGDLVVIDRSRTAVHGNIIIAVLNGEPLIKRLVIQGTQIILQPENPTHRPLYVMEGDEFETWGVVRYNLHPHAIA